MPSLSLNEIVEALPEFEVHELSLLASALKAVRQIKESNRLSSDSLSGEDSDEAGMSVDEWAFTILEEKETYELTLADQALLAALILGEVYQQDEFSSRDINDVIAKANRPRVAHITSTIFGLMSRNYLTGETKQLTLSPEGRAKARRLIGLLRHRQKAA